LSLHEIFGLFGILRDAGHGTHGEHGKSLKKAVFFREIRVQNVFITAIPKEPIFVIFALRKQASRELLALTFISFRTKHLVLPLCDTL
jgi:hypothetical protein